MNFHVLEWHNSRLVGVNCHVLGIQIRRDSYNLRRSEELVPHGQYYLVSYLCRRTQLDRFYLPWWRM